MNWWRGFVGSMRCNVPLGRLTWFKLGGPARFLCRPRDAAELAALVQRAQAEAVPLKVLGAGANVLIRDDGFDGVVVRLDQPAFRERRRRGTSLEVGAGVNLMPLSKHCSLKGLSGLECMAGIPGTVGGAVRMNAGGTFGEFREVVREADVLLPDGRRETWSCDRLGFDYRASAVRDEIVLSVRLELREDDPVRVRRRYAENFACKTKSQPLGARSAGCIFKNPAGQSAGALIDRAGLKGTRIGGARVSRQHANFILAERDATASDVLCLIDLIRDRVACEFNTALEAEVDIWK